MKFLLVLVFVYSVCVTPLLANSNRAPFIPASSVAETLEQHRRVPNPADEVWWMPKGRDMLWNNKNIHQLFPTVNIYRNGPVKPLSYKLNNQIDNFKIKTPQGKLAFVDFLKSDLSSNRFS